MDLGTIQDLLGDFATFGKNIGNALQSIPELIGNIVGFFTGFEDTADNTETAFNGLSSESSSEAFDGSSETEVPEVPEDGDDHDHEDGAGKGQD